MAATQMGTTLRRGWRVSVALPRERMGAIGEIGPAEPGSDSEAPGSPDSSRLAMLLDDRSRRGGLGAAPLLHGGAMAEWTMKRSR